MTGTDRNEAFYERFDIARIFAPYVGCFFLDVDDGVVGADCAVDKVAAVDGCGGEVGWCSSSCKCSLENGRAIVTSC
jgi:hypothetical protein